MAVLGLDYWLIVILHVSVTYNLTLGLYVPNEYDCLNMFKEELLSDELLVVLDHWPLS